MRYADQLTPLVSIALGLLRLNLYGVGKGRQTLGKDRQLYMHEVYMQT